MSEAKAYALYDDQGALVNVILWDGDAALPEGHKAELYDPAKHAAAWAKVSAGDDASAEPPAKPRKRLLGK